MLEFSTTAKMRDSDMHAAYIFILLMNNEWNSFCNIFLEFVSHTQTVVSLTLQPRFEVPPINTDYDL
jgi:hypothetical protein